VLKCASPGVSDVYQGNELWDLSLVDPDNRRAVDFAHRRARLDELLPWLTSIEGGGVAGPNMSALLAQWEDGRIKLFVTAMALRFRRRHADVMIEGAYVPLQPEGPQADHLVAFARTHATGTLMALVPRLVVSLTDEGRALPLGDSAWTSTRIRLPDSLRAPQYRHLLTGATLTPAQGPTGSSVAAADALRTIPLALLWAPRSGG
jgi:(1->4)-alpha-D-glucan 1-alpha-D-glucosylmutase